MDAKEIARKIMGYMPQTHEYDGGESLVLAKDYLRLHAENEALKAPNPTLESIGMTAIGIESLKEYQAIIIGLGCQIAGASGALRVIAEKDAAIDTLTRQRDEARNDLTAEIEGSEDIRVLNASKSETIAFLTARAEAAEKKCEEMEGEHQRRRLLIAALDQNIASLRKTGESLAGKIVAAEKERDEAVQHYHAAIELEGPQKYATLLDERDALAGRLEAAETALGNLRGHSECLCNEAVDILAAINPAPEPIIPPSC